MTQPCVVLLNPIGGIGGAERILLGIARHLAQDRKSLHVAAVLFGHGPLEEALAAHGVDVRVLPLPESAAELGDSQLRGQSHWQRLAALSTSGFAAGPNLLRHARQLRALLHSLRPNLIHSNGLKSHLLGSLATPDVPMLWHVHDFYSQRPLMANVLRQFSQKAARAIAISKAVQNDIASALPRLPSTLIYNGIDTKRFSPGPGDTAMLDALAGLPPFNGIRVGLIATYANWKGHDVFLRAIAKLPKGPARFYIIGGPIYSTLGSQFSRDELQRLAGSLGIADHVGFIPFQSDPAAVDRALDVVVHASTRPEPFGLTITEAMGCARAVVVANAGGASELFTHDVDALGHTPGDADSLADAMQRVIADAALRECLGAAARKTVVERFSEERLGREVRELYSEYLPAIRRRRPPTEPAIVNVPSPARGFPPLVLPRRVVYFNPIGGIGGAEQSLLRIFDIMRRYAPQVECRLLAGSDGPLLERARSMGVQSELIPMHDALRRLGASALRGPDHLRSRLQFATAMPRASMELGKTRRWLTDWFEHNPPDLIHSNGLKTHLLAALTCPLHVPLLLHIRDFLTSRPLVRWSMRWMACQATLAVANSNAVARDARAVFGKLPVLTLYNSVDIAHFSQGNRNPARLDELAGLPPAPPNTLRIGLVATYANWKGHDVLLKAAARLPDIPPFRVYLIGDPIYATPGSQFTRAELEALADRLGIREHVGFIPYQHDTADVYRKLDIVVHASTRPEPFGLTIAEAMACGRVVVVSAAGGATELFTEGEDALGHPPGDVDILAKVLRRLMRDPALRERLGENARRTAEQRHSEKHFARELLALYSQCLTASSDI